MRLFVAAWPSPAVRDVLADLPRTPDPALRWLPAETWHVTLRFLGEVGEEGLPALTDAIAAVGRAHGPRTAELGPATVLLGAGQLVVPVAGIDELAGGVATAVAPVVGPFGAPVERSGRAGGPAERPDLARGPAERSGRAGGPVERPDLARGPAERSGRAGAVPAGAERPFVGHLTLARARGRRRVPKGLAGEAVHATWTVADITLVRSHLGPEGSTYEVLARVPLTGPA